MTESAPLVLVVDDDQPNLDLFVRLFDDAFPIVTARSAAEAFERLEATAKGAGEEEIAVVVTDHRMPAMTGVDLLAECARRFPDVRRILLTAYSDRDLLFDAIRRGHVHEYVLKPWDGGDLKLRVEAGIAAFHRARDLARAERENARLRAEIDEQGGGGGAGRVLVGLASLGATIAKLAASDAPLVVRGETGAGKEIVARAIHGKGPRADKPFARVACRSENAEDRFADADGGTLFLDEVSDLSLDGQARLLEALDRGARYRLVAATREDLEARALDGRFLQPLFFRLNVVPVRVPPLRDRREDVPALARHFVSTLARSMGKELAISDDALSSLEAYDWPGNVRELRNVVERACILAEDRAVLECEDLLFDFAATVAEPARGSIFDEIGAEEAERVTEALKKAGGNRARAARLLGVPRTTLNDRIKRLGIA